MATDKFEITLHGEASLSLPAERAILRIDVCTTDVNKQTSFDAVLSTAKNVEALLRKLSPKSISDESKLQAAVDHWSRTSLSETSQMPYGKSRPPRQYTASVTFEARFQRFQAISGLIKELGAISHVKTKPLEWVLLQKTKDENRSALRKLIPIHLSEGYTNARSTHSKAPRIDFDDDDQDDEDDNSDQNMVGVETEAWEEVGGDVFRYQPENVNMSTSVNASFYAL
ncbi:hypothetical protein M409DRAFT_62075 [Zasmidium cellare ATCC 36951]|uniref:Uncharacterized protein n=1 Tax=Zasmidium cellare ATCC 36951 TaxID=1080233 RepID=A0A6A6D349_ZASCE|nr:uncharacterized protein M409DRAFT_62075 [Zasmidium cellare ATCC 36951]KAF2173831.1 hypothetical protein M409DRAFT_62075 [Zasmidium cellare ATCC 36951]